ncbi:MAG TPA: cellobiose phosphorylase [Legionella sp.]|nr:cellobiose phosphorylase [Legionella sp.]
MNKHIILCADDYGQNEAISAGILRLVQLGRINAVSCMVNMPSWAQASSALIGMKSSLYIGLHLNLTDGVPFTPLPVLIKNAYLRRLNVQAIAAEIQTQINAFVDAMEVYPDFIDGHQHVHQLPMVRDALLLVYKRMGLKAFIRNTHNGWHDLWSFQGFPKRQLIALLGGMTLRRLLVKQGISSNTSFAGIYPFHQSAHYRDYFKPFLGQIQEGGLIMCHPGDPSEDPTDPLSPYRHHELHYFLSDEFLSDLKANSIQLRCKDI